jgi:hypothetical protein
MPRQARKKSKTGVYHIMLRGINHQTKDKGTGTCLNGKEYDIILSRW